MTINAVVLYWVTGYRPDDQHHNYYLTTINFSVPFSTHSIGITSSQAPVPTSDLVIPPPAHDKGRPYRHTSAMTSFDGRTPCLERTEGALTLMAEPGQQHD